MIKSTKYHLNIDFNLNHKIFKQKIGNTPTISYITILNFWQIQKNHNLFLPINKINNNKKLMASRNTPITTIKTPFIKNHFNKIILIKSILYYNSIPTPLISTCALTLTLKFKTRTIKKVNKYKAV